jgi:hypothetical protein
MNSATSANAQVNLDVTERELESASDVYDRALVHGSESDISSAEETLAQLRRRHTRLERQVGILKEVEVVDERLQSARTRKRIDEELIRCRRAATQALEEFTPLLREHLAQLFTLAGETLGEQFEALANAQKASDQYYNHPSAIAVEYVYHTHAIDPAMLSVLVGLSLPEDLRRPHTADLDVLLGIEAFLRQLDQAAPRPAA